ncbi:Predicted dithiol-disulfide isomerase, DsbA family [Nocardioides scoriae]|uniref:Predicted dithiol-disulfide isomerase, DsbA family n=1 Tax=Nocardioides scoriae TaxID=642780 RepID=A0A1H1Y9U9_9ACTN|nr:DsbA family oxidoreductase [Nocardioides scoriae]SDT18171.1 Predicted dithiol-disulfide isomerase, DsbA family [Nocardioides scoriae]
MLIEIWSDVVCPWCYIGKRRLETALGEFAHADDVEIVYRSFQLDPSAPLEATETIAEALGRKYGGGTAAGQQMVDRVEAVAAEEGLLFRFGQAQHVATVDAHRVLHLALEQGRETQVALKEELLAAYFLRADNVADHDVLRAAAAKVGLDARRVDEVLASQEYADAMEADIRQAAAYGATGVPFFVVDRAYGISGAQPAETFLQVLDQAWTAAHPQLQTVGGGDDACGPDGCAL